MNDIDKAFEKYKVIEVIFNGKTELEPRFYSKEEEDKHGKTFTAGAEYGSKQARIKALEEIKKKLLIFEDISSGDTLEALGYKQGLQRNKALKYIDTELKKLRSE